MNDKIRSALAVLATLLPLVAGAQAAENYPSRTIRLVLPYSPGGPTDVIARAVATHMEASLGVTVLVENKPGGQGVISMQSVLLSRPDGYTVGWAPTNVLTTNRMLIKDLPYKLQDFKLVTTLYRGGMVFAVPKDSPANSLRQFVDLARREGKPMIYGTAGPGSGSHLTVEWLAQIERLQTQMIPYKGDSPMSMDVLGGTLPGMIGTVATTGEQYRRGNLKILGFTGGTRMEAYPDVPTFKESGYPIESYFWAGAVLPAATPEPIAAKLRAALHAAMRGSEVKTALTPDIVPIVGGEREYRDLVDTEYARWSSLIKSRNIATQ